MIKNLFGFLKWIGPECRKSSKNSKKLEHFLFTFSIAICSGEGGGDNVVFAIWSLEKTLLAIVLAVASASLRIAWYVSQSWRENVSFLRRSQIMFPLRLHVLFPVRFFSCSGHCIKRLKSYYTLTGLTREPGCSVLKA